LRRRGEETWHDGAPEGSEALGAGDAEAMLAFLQLL
jgi:hypothetical protein